MLRGFLKLRVDRLQRPARVRRPCDLAADDDVVRALAHGFGRRGDTLRLVTAAVGAVTGDPPPTAATAKSGKANDATGTTKFNANCFNFFIVR